MGIVSDKRPLVFNCLFQYVGYYRHIKAPLGAEKGMAFEQILNVLFLCTGNSARSIMAEALLNRLGAAGRGSR